MQLLSCSKKQMALGLLMAFCVNTFVHAEPFPIDSPELFKRTFLNRGDEDRKNKLLIILNKTNALGDLSKIILMPDWQYIEGNKRIADINGEVRTAVIQKFKTTGLQLLKEGQDDAKTDLAILIGETASANLVDETSESLDQRLRAQPCAMCSQWRQRPQPRQQLQASQPIQQLRQASRFRPLDRAPLGSPKSGLDMP
jgi:hypothetical protein